jgi:LAO/AO transport system kinase
MTSRPLPDPEALASAVATGERAALARAITLVESSRMDHQALARRMLKIIMPLTGKAQRVGITGVPGAGKSTTIEALGGNLTAAGHKVAVLAVDPSSGRTGGSILGIRPAWSSSASIPMPLSAPHPPAAL